MYPSGEYSSDDEVSKAVTSPAPPVVLSFQGLFSFKDGVKDTILCSIDFEQVDHVRQGTDLARMSEIGVAIYDPRLVRSTPPGETSTTPNLNETFIQLVRSMIAYHIIIGEWQGMTENTCRAFWHKDRTNRSGMFMRGKAHTARPYHCQFARSTIMKRDEAIEWLKKLLKSLTTQILTAEESEKGEEREVRLLFWNSLLEDKIFHEAGIGLPEVGKNIQGWDLQSWMPFRCRFRGQAGGEKAFRSLGVLGTAPDTVLHNATNDATSQLLGLLRLLATSSEDEWETWLTQKVDLPPIALDWIDKSIYEHNINMSPEVTSRNRKSRQPRSNYGNRVQNQQLRRQPSLNNSMNAPITDNETDATPRPIMDSPVDENEAHGQKETENKNQQESGGS
ncbi:hypothetical protein B0T20DRAFT_477577 [Sordaria brevicollis]|uniref:Gfd2/YDR514C-like C-terminal domain-containing protein n=1 Tax=Sordaria brevicollis TaxID=83679 RepID=A0AAE0PGT9_SORBR|nr:hypothetical protein B0T20DRAFT_477577 [Sordaria brevicollis]